MKRKFCLLITANMIFTTLLGNICFAAEPTVEHEYIAKNTGEYKEKISVDYSNLLLKEGDRIRVSFFDDEDEYLDSLYIEFAPGTLQQEQTPDSSDITAKAAYVYIELIGSDYDPIRVGLSDKIRKRRNDI